MCISVDGVVVAGLFILVDVFPAGGLSLFVYFAGAAPVAADDAGAGGDTDAEVVDAGGDEGVVAAYGAVLERPSVRARSVVVRDLNASLDFVLAEEFEVVGGVIS
jgi:hypothetical protein